MEPSGPNAEQIEYWNQQAGKQWVDANEKLDAMLAPFGHAAQEVAALRPGEGVLDVGCGVGQTTLELARRVGPSGSVLGIDISAPMLARAQERARAAGLANVRFENADAQIHAFTPSGVDVVFSRFGVMFFADPTAAFANLARALRPGGRVSFVCWQAMMENAWMRESLAAVLKHVPPPPPADPYAPGPFAFADAARVRGILERAGLRDVRHEPLTGKLSLGASLDEAAAFAVEIGPASRLLRECPEAARVAAIAELRKALEAHATRDGVALGYAAWLVRAER
jgi:SAM-dependent methyltransferase